MVTMSVVFIAVESELNTGIAILLLLSTPVSMHPFFFSYAGS